MMLQAYQQLAEGLACSKQIHSKLICPVTRELMNEHNPPVVLPNGAVYSERAVQDLANREGQFSCPSTGMLLCSCPSLFICLQCWIYVQYFV